MEKRDKDRLLADFVGTILESSLPDLVKHSTTNDIQWRFPFCDGYYPNLANMKFNKSWDWLIPVYNKWVHEVWHGSYSYMPERIKEFITFIADDEVERAYEYLVLEVKKLKDGKNTAI